MTELSRQYVKVCDLRDYADPQLLEMIGSLLPERDPRAHIERKVWEFGMLMLFLAEVGLLHEGTEALSVGAGDERVLFWLANRIGRMVATDIYGQGNFAAAEAQASMLEDPSSHAPYPYREDRLEVLWMDGRALSFPAQSFDLVFSISSIEHFGTRKDVARAAAEMGRVLRPGGYAVIATDCLVHLHPLDATPAGFILRTLTRGRRRAGARPLRRGMLAETFSARELRTRIVEPSRLGLLQPLDRSVSPETWETVGDPRRRILVRVGRSLFTSVCLVLQKPPAGRAGEGPEPG